MLNFKNALAAITMAIGVAGAAPASAAIYGGIDFGTALGNANLETATLAQTFINGNGQSAQAYGYISSVNGNEAATYCVSQPCGLYYVATFSNSQNFSAASVEFTASSVAVYYGNIAHVNFFDQSSISNIAAIQALTPWVTLSGHNNLGVPASPSAVITGTGQLTGASGTGTGQGLLDVNLGGAGLADVKAYLNSNGIPDAIGNLADIAFTSSFNNFVTNPNDTTTGCLNGTAAVGSFCYQGTSNLRGLATPTVPEPGALGILGLSMLGIVGFMRRRKS